MTTTTQAERGWIPDTSTFAARLAAIRNAMGWNVKRAAEEAGVAVQSWRNWESGTRPQDMPSVINRLSKSLGVDRDWLMWGSPGTDLHPDGGVRRTAFSPLLRRASDLVGAAA